MNEKSPFKSLAVPVLLMFAGAHGQCCERSEAISKEARRLRKTDRNVASLLAMTQRRLFSQQYLVDEAVKI